MSVVERFLTVAREHPQRVALEEAGGRAITYAELERWATLWAGRLRARGVGAEIVIGLGLEKSPEYVVALLAVWIAGGAWVPLDPELPTARLQAMIADAQPLCVLTTPRWSQRMESGPSPVLCLEALDDGPVESVPPAYPASSLAYVIFTSGSTGAPKGVMVPHSGLVGMLEAQIEAFELGPESRSLFVLQTSFDAAVSDVGTALLAGAALLFEPPGRLAPGPGFLELLEARTVTYVDLPVRYLERLDPTSLSRGLRTVVVGGEVSDPKTVRRWASRVRLVVVYGPTEATVCTSLVVCDPTRWTEPCIGHPIADVHYRVDGTGELWISTQGLARGYLGQPELTSSRFVEHEGKRWYRTRDRVRPGGAMGWVFCGRLDRQVKLRGQLVEPAEIEARLCAQPGVVEAAVVVSEAGRERELMACVVGDSVRSEVLRDALLMELPAWMVPTRWKHLDALPRNAVGKVDHAALQSWDEPSSSRERVCPRGPLEELLCQLFGQVLGRSEVSIHDDFVADLGGSSLDMLGLVAAAEPLGVSLAPSQIMSQPTVAGLAALLSGGAGRAWDTEEAIPAWRLREDVLSLWDGPPCTPPPSRGIPDRVFMTGTTGFLGARWLVELLGRSEAQFDLLVRARGPRHALDRVRLAIQRHGVELTEAWARRICVHVGDLETPRMGLSPTRWETLCVDVSAVVHCAAKVHMVATYRALREANVVGTLRALELAHTGRLKSFHLASTLSVFVASDRNQGVALEDDGLDDTRLLYGGYGASKWAAEVLVRERAEVPVHVYRLGLITGDSQRGGAPEHDLLTLTVRGLAALEAVPPLGPELAVDITPVDYAAAALAELVLRKVGERGISTFHIANPILARATQLIDAIRACGARLEVLDAEAWGERLRAAPDGAAVSLALSRWSIDGARRERLRGVDLFAATGMRFDQKHTRQALRGCGLSCPPPDAMLLERIVRGILDVEKR